MGAHQAGLGWWEGGGAVGSWPVGPASDWDAGGLSGHISGWLAAAVTSLPMTGCPGQSLYSTVLVTGLLYI